MKLNILWVNDNKESFLQTASLYALKSQNNNWWDEVRFIIWGPSAKLMVEDTQIQTELFEMKNAGVSVVACQACTDSYGITEKTKKLGIEVDFVGKKVTEYLQNDEKFLTI